MTFSAPKIKQLRLAAAEDRSQIRLAPLLRMLSCPRSGRFIVRPSARPRGMIVTLCKRIVAGDEQADQRMARLVVSGEALLILASWPWSGARRPS